MKWKVIKKPKKKKTKPRIGDIKEKVKFAFFPTKINNNYVWLEKYIVTYEFKKYDMEFDIYDNIKEEIKCFVWLETNKRIIKK